MAYDNDQLWDRTALRLLLDGANGTTTIVDSSSHALTATRTGDVAFSNATAKLGATSLRFKCDPFTLPVAQFPDSAPSDAQFSNVVLLLHGQGANNAQVFTDSSASNRTATAVGDVKTSTSAAKWGTSSMYFDGSGDRILFDGATADFNLGDTYTVEFYAWPDSLPASQVCRLLMVGDTGSPNSWTLGAYPSGAIGIGIPSNATVGTYAPAGTFSADAWHHYAFVVISGNVSIFKDGVYVIGGKVTPQSGTPDGMFKVGYDTTGGASDNYKGYLADVRITKGVARYTPAIGGRVDFTDAAIAVAPTCEFTLECWLYLTQYDDPVVVFDQFDATLDRGIIVLITKAGSLHISGMPGGSDGFTLDGTIALNTWTHVAVIQELFLGGSFNTGIFINGIASPYTGASNGALLSGTRMTIGCDRTGHSPFLGYLEDVRYTPGYARYRNSKAFSPPARLPTSSGTTTAEFHMTLIRDMERGGKGFIVGEVERHDTPTDQPLARRVRLIDQREGTCIRETWSEPVAGHFEFRGLDETRLYTLLTHDHLNSYRDVVANNIQAEV